MSGIAVAKVEKDWQALLKRFIPLLNSDKVLAVTGSLYFISEVKPAIVKLLTNHPA